MIVLDTAPLFYWLYAPDKLTLPAVDTINHSSSVIVNSISIWELGLKAKKGYLNLPQPIEALVQTLKTVNKVKLKAVDEQIWIENLNLAWEHKDPADRAIVATAKLINCPLITPDSKIRVFYNKTIW